VARPTVSKLPLNGKMSSIKGIQGFQKTKRAYKCLKPLGREHTGGGRCKYVGNGGKRCTICFRCCTEHLGQQWTPPKSINLTKVLLMRAQGSKSSPSLCVSEQRVRFNRESKVRVKAKQRKSFMKANLTLRDIEEKEMSVYGPPRKLKFLPDTLWRTMYTKHGKKRKRKLNHLTSHWPSVSITSSTSYLHHTIGLNYMVLAYISYTLLLTVFVILY
jgi:hypothetical protein